MQQPTNVLAAKEKKEEELQRSRKKKMKSGGAESSIRFISLVSVGPQCALN
jgi:hypothetical protein